MVNFGNLFYQGKAKTMPRYIRSGGRPEKGAKIRSRSSGRNNLPLFLNPISFPVGLNRMMIWAVCASEYWMAFLSRLLKAIISRGSLALTSSASSLGISPSRFTSTCASGKRFCIISTERNTSSSNRSLGYSSSCRFLSESSNRELVMVVRFCCWVNRRANTSSY